VDYREAPRWRTGVDAALEAVADIASGPRAGIALKLIEHAIDRIEAAFEAIDDSDGHLAARTCARSSPACRSCFPAGSCCVRPGPVRARDENSFETFAGALGDYADVLGEQGLAEYRRLAITAWDRLRANSGRTRAANEEFGTVHQLKGILDFFAERDGDVEARIALRSTDLSSPWSYLELAEFCLSEGREAEALRRAEEGLWLFEDRRPDERLLFFAVKLLTKARRKADAETHLWRAFEKAPSLDIYKQLRRIGGEPAAPRALAFLEYRLTNSKGTDWRDRPDVLVEILMHEKLFDAAWSAVRKFGASVYAKQALVEATDTKYPSEALEYYAEQVEQLANGGVYAEAAKQIARMGKLRSATEQAAFVAELKARHGRKRNFMKLLK
jgi:hypothetical protein